MNSDAPALTSRRILSPPWTLQEVDDGTDFPAITPLDTWGTLDIARCGLTAPQGRRLGAIHEAGHVVLFQAAGYPIVEAAIYPDSPRAPDGWQRPGEGHTRVGEPSRFCTPGSVIQAILAGQIATEMWLERQRLLNERSRLLTYSLAGPDHERLLMAEGALFLYGDAEAPAGWESLVFRVDRLTEQARCTLEERWALVTAIAEFLDEYGTADAHDLDAIAARSG